MPSEISEITIHSTKVSLNIDGDDFNNLSLDKEWILWKKAIDKENSERKKQSLQNLKLIIDLVNKSSSTDIEELKSVIFEARNIRDIYGLTKGWGIRKIVVSNDFGDELYLEDFENLDYQERLLQLNNLIDSIDIRINELSKSQKGQLYKGLITNMIYPLPEKVIDCLFNNLDGYFSPYDKDFFRYAINGGNRPLGFYELRWKKSKALLAYLIDKINCELKSNKTTQWKHAEQVFNVGNLRVSKNDWVKSGALPKQWNKIDDIINKAKLIY